MISSYSVKRSKFEYIKQLFSKKPDKPKKYSAPSSPAPRTAYTFHRPSDVTSNYSTSDYASDNELDETTAVFPKIRSPVELNRNSKIASIVKRFEPNSSPMQTDNSNQLIDNPSTSQVIDKTHSQTLMDIQAISSDLSSLMTNISHFSTDNSAVNNTSCPQKQIVVETLIEPQINPDDTHTPKVITSYSIENKTEKNRKSFDLTLDSSLSSEQGDDMLSLDDFLNNLSPPKLLHTRYPRYPLEDDLDSDTNTEKGSTDEVNRAVIDMTSSTDMEMTMESTLIEAEITMDASINPEDSLPHQTHSDRPVYIDINSKLSSLDDKMTRVMQDFSTRVSNILPTENSPEDSPKDGSNQETPMTSREIPQTHNLYHPITSSIDNPEPNTVMTSPETVDSPVTSCNDDIENFSVLYSDIQSPFKLVQEPVPVESPALPHRHAFSLSSDDVTNLVPMSRSPTLPDPLDSQATYSDACSVHSVPGYASRHKYTGYSLPPGETRTVSERIRSLLCKEPIDCAKVDKLSLARAAIERRKSETKPAYLPDRPVLIEIKEPEEFSVRSLRDRFEFKMRQIEPSGVMLTPSQIAKPARKKSDDLGIKPTFAG